MGNSPECRDTFPHLFEQNRRKIFHDTLFQTSKITSDSNEDARTDVQPEVVNGDRKVVKMTLNNGIIYEG